MEMMSEKTREKIDNIMSKFIAPKETQTSTEDKIREMLK
jgi:hypothetical protein